MLKNILQKFFKKKRSNKNNVISKIRLENETCVIEDNVILKNVHLGLYVTLLKNSSLKNTTIDNYSYVAQRSVLNNVSVGKFCSIGPDLKIGLNTHPINTFVSTHPAFYSPVNDGCAIQIRTNKIFNDEVKKTVIEHDVWLGANVIIPGGIKIATGSVIAAGSVVIKDVEPYSIVGGNPAKLIKYRFSPAIIEKLMMSKWWEWPLSVIKENIDRYSNIDEFIEYLDSIHKARE